MAPPMCNCDSPLRLGDGCPVHGSVYNRDALRHAEAARDRYRKTIREALDIMGNATDGELGEGGVARKAYARLWHAYFAVPAGIETPPPAPPLNHQH